MLSKLLLIGQTTDPDAKAGLIAELIAGLPTEEVDDGDLADFTGLFEAWDESSDDQVKATVAEVLLANDAAGFNILRKDDDLTEMDRVQTILCAAANAERLPAIITAINERLTDEDCYPDEAVNYFDALKPMLTQYPEHADALRALLQDFVRYGHVDPEHLEIDADKPAEPAPE